MERDGFRDPAWCDDEVEVAEYPAEVLQRPGDCDSTFGVSTPSQRVRSRRGRRCRRPNSRFLPASPGIPDYRRQRMARLARPKNLPRLIVTSARNREPW